MIINVLKCFAVDAGSIRLSCLWWNLSVRFSTSFSGSSRIVAQLSWRFFCPFSHIVFEKKSIWLQIIIFPSKYVLIFVVNPHSTAYSLLLFNLLSYLLVLSLIGTWRSRSMFVRILLCSPFSFGSYWPSMYFPSYPKLPDLLPNLCNFFPSFAKIASSCTQLPLTKNLHCLV